MFKIRDGNDSANVLLSQLSGTTVPQYMLSSTRAMFLIFTSDAANVLDGYSVTWEAKLSTFTVFKQMNTYKLSVDVTTASFNLVSYKCYSLYNVIIQGDATEMR